MLRMTDATGRMISAVYRLASDEYAGRRVGTPGGRAAAKWLAEQLRGAAIAFEEFPVDGTVKELYRTPSLHWTDGKTSWDLAHRRDFCEHLASADLPFARTGKWLLDKTFSAERAEQAAAAGVLGLLVPRGTDDAGWMPKMIAGPSAVELPVLALRNDIHEQMSATTATVTASVPMRTVDVVGVNVHAVFASPRPDGVSVLLTAHYDGVGDDPGVRFPAAADNASGVAVMLEAARQLANEDLGIGLAVAFLDAEEVGAHGSAYHAPKVRAGTYVINVDGAAALHEAAAVEAGGPAQPLLAALDLAGRETGVPLRARAMPSDNRRYAAAGLPAIGIGMGIPGYQTPAETPDRVDPQTLARALALVVSTVRHLSASRSDR
ncbi:MAG TPA: aminopeptidase [Micromonosporaceae bacterium]|nr:aminopeptidase [Micromonosporaceae bacterium]